MFRPNRIGTPWIKQLVENKVTAAWTPILPGNAQQAWFANVINTTPLLDFGETNLSWTGGAAVTITNATRLTLGQQITVSPPLTGDTVGIEIEATIVGNFPKRCTFTPVFGRINAAVSLLTTATFSTMPSLIGDPKTAFDATTSMYWGRSYRTQVIVQNANLNPGGVYLHGFQINNNNGADFSLDAFMMNASVRQLNDQQSIGYRDTLR